MAISEEAKAARRQHLIQSAHALIHESGTGFSMLQLAEHAGVSPATPYNLLGNKTEVLRHVIQDEFERFTERLAALTATERPLLHLLTAIDQVVVHYAAEPAFYRGLYRAMQGTEVRTMMSDAGQSLWSQLVRKLHTAGELDPRIDTAALTAVLLRAMGGTTQTWLAEHWDTARFTQEMHLCTRLPLLGLVSDADRAMLLASLAT